MQKNIIIWKHIWDLVISEEKFREFFFHSGPSYDLTLKNTSRITAKSGTFYIPPSKNEDEGHFIAYEIIGPKIYIYDSSKYAFQQFSKNPELAKSIELRSGKKVVKLRHHPQDVCHEDTFCQTWSLAWLTPELRHISLSKTTPRKTIERMYKIIHFIIRKPAFKKFIIKYKNDYNGWIQEARTNKNILGRGDMTNTDIKNANNFIQYSKTITERKLAEIMLSDKQRKIYLRNNKK
jgi:hypothetical protein